MYDCTIDSDCDKSSNCAIGECCGSSAAPVFHHVCHSGSSITPTFSSLLYRQLQPHVEGGQGEEVTMNTSRIAKSWQNLNWIVPHIENHLTHLIVTTMHPLGMKGKRLTHGCFAVSEEAHP